MSRDTMDTLQLNPEESEWTGRNKPKPSLETKPFIAWDGEGINLKGDGKPQSYVLFGCTEGYVASREGLSVWQCLDLIIEIGKRFPQRISHRLCLFIRCQHDYSTPLTEHASTIAQKWMGESQTC